MTRNNLLTFEDTLSDLGVTLPGISLASSNILVGGYDFEVHEDGLYWTFFVESREELVLAPPGLESFGIVIRDLGRIEFFVGYGFFFRLQTSSFGIRLPNTLFIPVKKEADGWIPETDTGQKLKYREIEIDSEGELSLDAEGNLNIDLPLVTGMTVSLKPVMLGNTNIVIEADDVSISFVGNDKGVSIDSAAIYLPPDLPATPDLKITKCFIGQDGFSGEVSAEWELEFSESDKVFIGEVVTGGLFGFEGGLKKFAVEFKENIPISTDIRGMMLLPFFDQPVDVEIGLSQTGEFSVIVKGAGPDGDLTLTKKDLFQMKVQSLALQRIVDKKKNLDETSLEVSGAIQPLFYGSEGVTWPEASVEGLKVGFRNGQPFVDIKGGWIDFKDQAVLDLYGFKAELNKIGFGREQKKLWIGVTGSVRLVELLPIGASMKQCRVLWDPNTDFTTMSPEAIVEALEFDLRGLEISHAIPQTMEFEGSAYLLKEGTIKGFGGDLYLNLPTAGFSAEAGMLVGMNFEDPPYPFFYIYLGVELPTGVPLGQSGLALKGAKGLFGYNVFPTRRPPENWYYDWYKLPPAGITHSTKWYPLRDALAFGAGVTITTTDGYIKGVKALLAFILPGPVFVIEGRALFLGGLKPDAEPPLRMLAILDGNAQTIQLNVEAEAELVKDVLSAYGGLEAFFDFNDVTLWHIYLGQDRPEDRRIQGVILKLFKANAYLMLDSSRMRMGAYIGIKKEFEYELTDKIKLSIDFDAWMEGRALLGWRPEQVEGELALEAAIGLSVPGLSLNLGAGAEVLTKGPNPFVVDATAKVKADLPWPLPDFETDLNFHWEAPDAPHIHPPVTEINIGNDLGIGGNALKVHSKELDTDKSEAAAEASPVVPLDARPLIAFNHPINDETESFFRDASGVNLSNWVGRFKLTPTLTQVKIYEHKKNDPWGDGWNLVYDSGAATGDQQKLNGVWLADNEPAHPDTPGARRLRLWTKSPFVHTSHTSNQSINGAGQATYLLYKGNRLKAVTLKTSLERRGLGFPQTDYVDDFLNSYPDYGTCRVDEAQPHCVDFDDETPGTKPDGVTIEGIKFSGENLRIEARPTALFFQNSLWIQLPSPAIEARLTIQKFTPLLSDTKLYRRRSMQEFVETTRAWEQKAKDFKEQWDSGDNSPELQKDILSHYNGRPVWADNLCAVEVPGCELERENGDTWIVRSRDGQPFQCVYLAVRYEALLQKICYLDAEEKARQGAQSALCESNPDSIPPGENIFKPGAYYRVVVRSKVEAELGSLDFPAHMPAAIRQAIWTMYHHVLDVPDSTDFVQQAFFQTDGPPTNLAPYVLWSSPADGENPAFRGYDAAVRFRRSYVKKLYESPEHQLYLGLYDTNGQLHTGEIIPAQYSKSDQSPFLYPYEAGWQDYASRKENVQVSFEEDDMVYVPLESPLSSQTRYELRVSNEQQEKLLIIDFVTSRFDSFEAMITSSGDGIADSTIETTLPGNINDVQKAIEEAVGTYAGARYQLQYIESAYKRKNATREEVEEATRILDNARLGLDEAFSAQADQLGVDQLVFNPLPDKPKIYRLVTETGQPVAFFLRSPEPIDWQEAIEVQQAAGNSEVKTKKVGKKVGRVDLKVYSPPNEVPLTGHLIYNADKTQAIFLFDRSNNYLNTPCIPQFAFEFHFEGKVDCPENVLQMNNNIVDERVTLTYPIRIASQLKRTSLSGTSTLGPALTTKRHTLLLGWVGAGNRTLNFQSYLGRGQLPPKITLRERTSSNELALTVFRGKFFVAWASSDQGTLQLIHSTDGRNWEEGATLRETSNSAPALAVYNNQLYLAWCDAEEKIRITRSADGETWQHFRDTGETTTSGPALVVFGNWLLLAWRDKGNNTINIRRLSHRLRDPPKTTLREITQSKPYLHVHGDRAYLAWQGVGNCWLNVIQSEDGRNWDHKTTFNETCRGGPALGMLGDKLVWSWTGTDQHLNIMLYD